MAIDAKAQTVRVTAYIPRKESPAHLIVHDMMVDWHDDGKKLQEHMFAALYDYALKYYAPGAPYDPPLSTSEEANTQANMISQVVLSDMSHKFEILSEILEQKLSSMQFMPHVSDSGYVDDRYDPIIKRILGDTSKSIINAEGNTDEDW